MKILIRLRGNEYLGYYILDDNETIKEQEFEELPYKAGYYNETYYDEKEKILKQRYIEMPKTKEQLLEEKLKTMQEQVEQANKAIEDLIMQNMQ
jgi:hypothetical protein